jgi:Vitamin K-dependent gamma-carboxylase
LVRILVGAYCVGLLLLRGPSLLRLAQLDDARFVGVGLAVLLETPLSLPVLITLLVLAFVGAVCFCLGVRHRMLAPGFAMLLLFLLSYRNSWGHMSHSEQLVSIHVLLLSVLPAADALSLDHHAGRTRAGPMEKYGWPLRLLMLCVVISYVLAGWAKLHYGGMAWVSGEAVYHQVGYDTLGKLRLGGFVSPLGPTLLRWPWLFAGASVFTLVIEIGALLAMLGGRLRTVWVIGAYAMHVGIALAMGIAFPYPLWGIAFVSFFELEHAHAWLRSKRRPTHA